MIHAMLLRLFRIVDRMSQLLVKECVWLGDVVLNSFQGISSRVFRRDSRISTPETDSARSERRVSSLSIAIVGLLALVTFLVIWGTSAQAEGSAVVRLFSIGATPQPKVGDSAPGAPPQAQQEVLAESSGTLVFSMVVGAQRDLFALSPGQTEPVRLTNTAADERDPEWSPDGGSIAYASRRDGNWELYVLDVQSGSNTRVTYDLAYESAPSWSPDGQWLAYEGYSNGNLDIYIIKVDGSEGPFRLTQNPEPDFSPAWTTDPAGREIAYTSIRNGVQDIYILSLDDPSETRAVNVSNTRESVDDSPAWSPGAEWLAYSVEEDGASMINVAAVGGESTPPTVIGQGYTPTWSPDGETVFFISDHQSGSLIVSTRHTTWETSAHTFSLPSYARDLDLTSTTFPVSMQGEIAQAAGDPLKPAFEEALVSEPQPGEDVPYRLVTLNVVAPSPYLSDRVDGSFTALRENVTRLSGWDFLGSLDGVLWDIDRNPEPGEESRNWHKAGRAFDIVQAYNLSDPPMIELVPEQTGAELTWRLYLRCAAQDGSQGEPLRRIPWDFAARTGTDVTAYENGGRYKDSIPAGYYIDFTALASYYGWHPAPADSSWRYNWPGVLFWQYENRGDLDWWSAMRELYTEDVLEDAFD